LPRAARSRERPPSAGMNKLYLQNLKAEQSIQKLRDEVAEAQAARKTTCGQLTEADRQIRDLHGQLGQSEREHRDLLHEIGEAESQGRRFQEVAAEAKEESRALVGRLRAMQRSVEVSMDMFRQADLLELAERDRMERGAEELVSRAEQLEYAHIEGAELEERLTVVQREGRGLQSELSLAGELDEFQWARLREARRVGAEELERCRVGDEERRELRTRVATLEQQAHELSADLQVAEGLQRENNEWRSEIELHREVVGELRHQEEDLAARHGVVNDELLSLEEESKVLDKQMADLNEYHAELHDSVVHTRMQKHVINDRVSRLRKQYNDLEFTVRQARLSASKQVKNWEESEETSAAEAERERLSLAKAEERHEYIGEEADEAASERHAAQEEVAELEDECHELRLRTEELDEEAAELRAKAVCSVC